MNKLILMALLLILTACTGVNQPQNQNTNNQAETINQNTFQEDLADSIFGNYNYRAEYEMLEFYEGNKLVSKKIISNFDDKYSDYLYSETPNGTIEQVSLDLDANIYDCVKFEDWECIKLPNRNISKEELSIVAKQEFLSLEIQREPSKFLLDEQLKCFSYKFEDEVVFNHNDCYSSSGVLYFKEIKTDDYLFQMTITKYTKDFDMSTFNIPGKVIPYQDLVQQEVQ